MSDAKMADVFMRRYDISHLAVRFLLQLLYDSFQFKLYFSLKNANSVNKLIFKFSIVRKPINL